jgi:hypothetical protein
MKNIFWTVRYQRINNNVDLWNVNLNGNYTPSFYLNNAFSDRVKQNIITNLYDMSINEENYTWTLPIFWIDWIPTWETFPILDRFFFVSYNEKINPAYWIDKTMIISSLVQVGNQFAMKIMTIDEIIWFIKMFTNLTEISPWKFFLSEDIIWKTKMYLNIREEGDVITNE